MRINVVNGRGVFRFAGATVGGPFWVLIKVSLLVFVVLAVGPMWLLIKLLSVVLPAMVDTIATVRRERMVSRTIATVREHRAQQTGRHRSQMCYSNRR